MDKKDWFTLGKITGVHGLGGNMKVWSYAQSIDSFREGMEVTLETERGALKSFSIKRAWSHGKGVLISIGGIDTRNLAQELVGSIIMVCRDQMPDPEEDSWYWQDLLGLEVVDEKMGSLGRIKNIFPTGADDMLVVKNREKETLVPMNRNFVISVNLEKGVLNTRLPKGF